MMIGMMTLSKDILASVALITSLADLPVDAQSEALLLQLGELGILSQNRDNLAVTNTYPPGAMGNNHQRGNCELPHKSFDQDWSLLGPCCPMAGVPIISFD